MNVLLTSICNRKCQYCFADGKIDYNKKNESNYNISVNNFKKILDFINPNDRISLLGGEPTLHRQFEDIIELLKQRKNHVNIFTNGIMPNKSLRVIEQTDPQQFSLTVNVNEPSENTGGQWRKVLKVLETVPKHSGLGFNIYRPDFNASFLVDLCNQYDIRKNIRLGLAQPIVMESNAFVPTKLYPLVGKKIVELSELCDKSNISLGFDCGFVMCMFTERQLGKLISNNVNIKFSCGPAIDIGLDLSVWSCFPLSKIHNTALEDYKTPQDIYNYYKAKLDMLYSNGIYNKCCDCKYLHRKQCSGGCAAHIINLSTHS